MYINAYCAQHHNHNKCMTHSLYSKVKTAVYHMCLHYRLLHNRKPYKSANIGVKDAENTENSTYGCTAVKGELYIIFISR